MHLRPTQARWFETYVPSEQAVGANEVLARTGRVQLELSVEEGQPADTERLRHFVTRFREVAASHADDLPALETQPTALTRSPVRAANQALYRLTVWAARVDFVREHIVQLQAEGEELLLLVEFLEAVRRAGIDYAGLFRQGRYLCRCLFACSLGWKVNVDLEDAVEGRVRGREHDFLYVASVPERQQVIQRLIVNHGCEPVGLSAWLPDQRGERERVLQAHLAQNTQEIAELERELATLRADPKIAEARANVETLGWYLGHATADITERRPAHIAGWTTAEDMDSQQRVPLFLAEPRTKLSSLPTALGELLLSAFELAMNTLSFVRVGAFALGHAALSHAVLALTLSVENPVAWIMILDSSVDRSCPLVRPHGD